MADVIPPPTQEEWTEFVEKLRFARKLQASAAMAKDVPADLHVDFAAIWQAFEAMLVLLMDQPDIASENLHLPLAKLGFALADVAAGRPSPLFHPHKRRDTKSTKGAPATSELALRAVSAMAMDSLIGAGHLSDVAARTVARVIENANIPVQPRNGSTVSSMITGWREGLMTGDNAAPAESLRIWRNYKSKPVAHGATAQDRADKFLRELRENPAFRFS